MPTPSIFDAEFRARACELARTSSKPRVVCLGPAV